MHGDTSCALGDWIVARTKPRQEEYARENVERQGFEPYVPKCLDERTKRTFPLFPGYIFIQNIGRWHSLRSTYGILDLIFGDGGSPARLPGRVVAELKARESKHGVIVLDEPKFKPLQRVRMMDGPFCHAVGLFDRYDGAGRVRVLLNLLGARCPVSVEEDYVAVA